MNAGGCKPAKVGRFLLEVAVLYLKWTTSSSPPTPPNSTSTHRISASVVPGSAVHDDEIDHTTAPFVDADGNAYFIGGHGNGTFSRDIDRDSVSYGTSPGSSTEGGVLVLYRFSGSDYGTPDKSLVLARPNGLNGSDSYDVRIQQSADGAKLFINVMKQGGSFNDPTSFLGDATKVQDTRESYLLTVDASTMALISSARVVAASTNNWGHFREFEHFVTGPASGKSFCPTLFGS